MRLRLTPIVEFHYFKYTIILLVLLFYCVTNDVNSQTTSAITRHVDSVLVQPLPTVSDAGQSLNRYIVNASHWLDNHSSMLLCKAKRQYLLT